MTNLISKRRYFAALLSLLSPLAFADSPSESAPTTKPLWEAGIGFAATRAPHYPGADQSHTLAAPFPLLIYRGKVFRSDEKGVRGRLFNSERLSLAIGASFSLPTDSEDNDARQGMDDLDGGLEIGPRLDVKLGEWGSSSLTFELPARALLVSDLRSGSHEGWIVEPSLDFRWSWGAWRMSAEVSSLWGSEKYHDYYYQVDPQFAQPSRPAFDASGGYGRSTYRLGAFRGHGDWRYGWRISQHSLSGSQVEDSPLVRRKTATYVGLVVLWTFAKSTERANSAN